MSEFYWRIICVYFGWNTLSGDSCVYQRWWVRSTTAVAFNSAWPACFFFIFFLIIIFWFFDFFGNWPNTLRCRQRVAWEWARATKKVRGYATFCNLNHTCPLTKVFGNSHLLILKFAVLSFFQSNLSRIIFCLNIMGFKK